MTFVWFSYGRLVNDHNIMTVNVTGKLRIGFFWSRNVGKKLHQVGNLHQDWIQYQAALPDLRSCSWSCKFGCSLNLLCLHIPPPSLLHNVIHNGWCLAYMETLLTQIELGNSDVNVLQWFQQIKNTAKNLHLNYRALNLDNNHYGCLWHCRYLNYSEMF